MQSTAKHTNGQHTVALLLSMVIKKKRGLIWPRPLKSVHQLLVQTPLDFAVNFSQLDWFLQMLQLANCIKNASTYCFMTSHLFFFLGIFFSRIDCFGGTRCQKSHQHLSSAWRNLEFWQSKSIREPILNIGSQLKALQLLVSKCWEYCRTSGVNMVEEGMRRWVRT